MNDNGNGKDANEKPTFNPAAPEGAVTDPCDVPETGPVIEPSESLLTKEARSTTPVTSPEKPNIVIPSSQTTEIIPGSAFSKALKVDDATLAQLGVTSEADLGDDVELERSPIDGACVVAAKVGGIQVCYYCFKPFIYGGSMPEYAPAEIEVSKPDGENQGIRCKVHGRCQLRKMQGLPIEE